MNDELPYFVYALMDPRDEVIFYIGKGKGYRPEHHLYEAALMENQSDKVNRIRDIQDSNNKVEFRSLARDLPTESEAFAVEALFIIESRETGSVLGIKSNLTNKDPGQHEERFRDWGRPELIPEFDYRKRPLDSTEMYKDCIPLFDFVEDNVPEFENAIRTTNQHIRSQSRFNGFDFVLNPKKGQKILFEYFARKPTNQLTREDQIAHVERLRVLMGKEKCQNPQKIEHKRFDLDISQHEQVAAALKSFINEVYEAEKNIIGVGDQI